MSRSIPDHNARAWDRAASAGGEEVIVEESREEAGLSEKRRKEAEARG